MIEELVEAIVDFLVLLEHELQPFLDYRVDATSEGSLLLSEELLVFVELSVDLAVEICEFLLQCIPLFDIQKVVINAFL